MIHTRARFKTINNFIADLVKCEGKSFNHVLFMSFVYLLVYYFILFILAIIHFSY